MLKGLVCRIQRHLDKTVIVNTYEYYILFLTLSPTYLTFQKSEIAAAANLIFPELRWFNISLLQ